MKIKTEFPDANHSPDFIRPVGATDNNFSSEHYISELHRMVNDKQFSYLDLGCAGGQAVVDVHNLGYVACGIDGSDLNKMLNHSVNGVGDNWKKYKDVCLFKADLTKSFELQTEDEIQQFDIITAWDVMEHPLPKDIPMVLDNIVKHMHKDSIFISLIALSVFSHHQTVKPREWWLNEFNKKGLMDLGFDMEATPRNSKPPIISNQELGFKLKLK